jgi:hypothetical protein
MIMVEEGAVAVAAATDRRQAESQGSRRQPEVDATTRTELDRGFGMC